MKKRKRYDGSKIDKRKGLLRFVYCPILGLQYYYQPIGKL